MKYKTVEIVPGFPDEGFRVLCYEMEGDRSEEEKLGPNALGFYHYPADEDSPLNDLQAFIVLKSHMISRLNYEINKLQKTVNILEKVSMSQGKE